MISNAFSADSSLHTVSIEDTVIVAHAAANAALDSADIPFAKP